MAISAYGPSGRLKKHALLGTSFAVDPKQELKRKQFETLYGEAKLAAGEGREPMLGALQSRFKGFEEEQAGRLAKLAEQKGAFEQQYAELNNPEVEENFKKYQEFLAKGEKGTNPEKFKGYGSGAARGIPWMMRAPQGLPEEVITEAWQQWHGMTPEEQSEWSRTHSHFGKKLPKKLNFQTAKKWDKRQPWVVGQLAQNIWADMYGTQKQQEYQENLTKAQEKINTAYTSLQGEEAGRQQRLADRIDLYNMFLGA